VALGLLPSLPDNQRNWSAHARSSPGRGYHQPDLMVVVPVMPAACPFPSCCG